MYFNFLITKIYLVFFIPIVVYLAGAVSTQSATIFIRSIAVDNSVSIKKYFFREIIIGIVLGLILGLMLGLFAFLAWNDFYLGIILLISVFLGIIFSVIFAITTPYILWKLHKDPAVGTNPLATILSDVLSVAVYLIIAKSLLNLL